MKIILKVLIWPVTLVLRLFCLLGTLLYTAAAYVVSPLLLFMLGCGIFCAVKGEWTQVAIFAVAEAILLLMIFGVAWMVANADELRNWLCRFLAT